MVYIIKWICLKIEKYGLKFYVCYNTPDHIMCRNMQYLQNWKFFAEINLLMLDFVTWCRWRKNKVLVTYSKIISGWAAEILFFFKVIFKLCRMLWYQGMSYRDSTVFMFMYMTFFCSVKMYVTIFLYIYFKIFLLNNYCWMYIYMYIYVI